MANKFKQEMQDLWHEKLQQHYAKKPLKLPKNIAEMQWIIRSALDLKDHKFQVKDEQELYEKIEAKQALKVKYDPREKGKYLEIPLLITERNQLLNMKEMLLDDLAIAHENITLIDAGQNEWIITIKDPRFQNFTKAEIIALLKYFSPDGYLPPRGRPKNKHGKRFNEYLMERLEYWAHMQPVQLEEHLKKKTTLGGNVKKVQELLAETDSYLLKLDYYPPIQKYLYTEAIKTLFPLPKESFTKQKPHIAAVGSLDAYRKHLVTGGKI